MSLAVRNEGSKVNSNINVTPMCDVMLVLLIIFMVITPMLQKGQQVQMVRAENSETMPDADKEDAVLIAVTRDNKVYLGTDQMTPDQLGPRVRDMVENRSDKRIYVRADTRAKYGTITDVVDNVRTAGVDDIGLLTEQRNPQATTGGMP